MANTLTDPYTNWFLNNLNKSPTLGAPGYFNKNMAGILQPVSYADSYQSNNSIFKPDKEKESAVESWMTGNKYFKPEAAKPNIETTKDWLTKNSATVGKVGNTLGSIKNMIPTKTDNTTTTGINTGVDAISDVAMSIPGYGQVVGAAIKAGSLYGRAINQVIGMENPKDGFSKVISSDLFTGMNPAIAVLNAKTATKVEATDKDLANLAQGYGDVNTSEGGQIGGISKAFSWLTGSKNKAKALQSKTDLYNTQNMLKASAIINNQNKVKSASNITQDLASKNNQQLFGGQNYRTLSAKKGTKLSFNTIKKKATQKMQEGGKMNLLPTGALHARKHNLSGELSEDITKKGIPVISYDEGGGIIQHAEVERDEIIFNIDLTKQLEKLKKDFDDGDENAALIAGQLLTKEILQNTIDKSKLIQNIT